ncbi:hypothetical protein MYCTH_2310467 [Thermothelomyces thermophilus ATCC 42464]|uniref:Uncharacterized protein n=1 Tax=Thermothelomyces thermophilus (strain ATCC 42464 / BCRC 31852 / DSM 1799) TaxID=573729 RepID=G2QLJ5_THET4|nr:uncharacterized protein MYCTH_2310467 [Thermothelomyces thermophilus ATCC 42464]AEO60825.1 hypothetical protein MYCTH_2310467 [Thermothelomyces thermophilus ATCC 42464]
MPLWLFRRKSHRRRGRVSSIEDDGYGGKTPAAGLPPRSQTVPEMAMTYDPSPPERQANKRQRTESNKLHRRARSYSFSPGREDAVGLEKQKSTRARRDGDTPMRDAPTAMDIMPWRAPTLHGKRDGDHLPRKLSSKKRRKEDRQREAEIKAMSSFAPHRPAAEDWMAGRPMRKESKKFRSGFGVSIKGPDVERYSRSSDISLPLPESIDSALSSDSDYISYEVSAFESLAPRPTLRYSTHARSGNYTQDGAGVVRRPSPQRTRLTESIPEEMLKAHKRVDSLADELSAGDLRELMERDQRRRARKRQLEQKKLELKIARQAEKQRAAEAEAEKHGRESPPNLSRGILGREDIGLGINPPSATITSSRLRNSDGLADNRNEAGDVGNILPTRENDRPEPLAAFHRVDSHSLQPLESLSEIKEDAPVLASTVSKASLRNTISRSKSPQESEARTEQSEQPSRGSSGNTAKGPRSWTSFFRWTNRTKRNSGGPSSFSNTSRDSMPTPPAPAPPINPLPRRLTSGVPKRTTSRFREDLPELPMSPPASRLQSPEAAAVPSPIKVSTNVPPPNGESCPSPPASRPRHDTPVSTRPSVEEMRETPSTFSRPDEPGVSPEPQSMSLASIDSEGSWFAGGLAKKRKSSGIPEHGSGLRRSRYAPQELNGEQRPEIENPNDDMDITDDDYLSRLTPSHGDRSAWNRKSTGEARPSSDWGEEDAHWGSVEGHLPTVVRSQAASRVKSREGLLRSFGEEGEATSQQMDAEEHRDSSDDVTLQRATSIGHEEEHASH